jgi:hypothetical protein
MMETALSGEGRKAADVPAKRRLEESTLVSVLLSCPGAFLA